jgi:single-strand DNA-binding protein
VTNVIVLEGNLTADAAEKMVGESQLTEFTIASNRYVAKGKEKTVFMACKWWGTRGAAVAGYLAKGKRVTVSGYYDQDEWTGNEDGKKHSRPFINVSDVSLGGGGSRDGAAPCKQEYGDEQTTGNSGSASVSDGDFTDDIPF